MTVFLGADHRGFPLKEYLKTYLVGKGYSVVDCGNTVLDPHDDYPDFAFAVAKAVMEHPEDHRGIVLCGNGAGVSIAVNKIDGVRAVLGVTPEQVKDARNDDDINIIALASNYLTENQASGIVDSFLTTSFGAKERYIRRIEKITTQEQQI
ncbi:MAG: RpiB/LacA/LacB family sugar-phosphate isomerase [Microgenomates group bacterium]